MSAISREEEEWEGRGEGDLKIEEVGVSEEAKDHPERAAN
jgi:hypothetical protein